MKIIVSPVSSRADRRRFIHFPEILYHGEPRWAPPLWSEEARVYNPKHNPILRESDFCLFLARRDGIIVGRVLAYVNHLWNGHYLTRSGMFGAYEAIDDQAVANALLAAVETWLTAQDCEEIIGPLHPVDEVFGFLVEGFAAPQHLLAHFVRRPERQHLLRVHSPAPENQIAAVFLFQRVRIHSGGGALHRVENIEARLHK